MNTSEILIINGSPRGKASNTQKLVNAFQKGYMSRCNEEIQVCFIASNMENAITHYVKAKKIILFFPMYTDAMPGLVKEFLEHIHGIDSSGKHIGFVIQSGFPEGIQTEALARYMKRFAERIHAHHIGTVRKGGVESIRVLPLSMRITLHRNFKTLGNYFAETNEFPEKLCAKMLRPYKLRWVRKWFMTLLGKKTPINLYWMYHFMKYKSMKNRWAKPYE